MLNKILLVEDEKVTSSYIYHKLEQLDCDVLAKASNCDDAVRLAKDLKPNLILMDINIDGESKGIDAATQILSFLDVPVVYITAFSDEDTIKRLMKTEPNAFIIKPFDERILRSAIDIAVYRHQVKKELLEAKEIMRTTLESIDDILISFDCKGYLTNIHSKHKEGIPFITSKESLKKHYREILPYHLVKLLDVSFSNLLKSKKAQEFDFQIQKHNINNWYHAKASLRRNINNNAIGVTLLVTDISRQKKLENELIKYSEKLNEAQDVANLGTCEIDFAKNELQHNSIFFKLLDIEDYKDIKSYDDNNILKIIHPEDKKRYLDNHKDVFKNKTKKFDIDFRIIDKKKEIRYIHSIGKVKYGNDEKPALMLITMQDVSWQRQSEELWKNLFTARKSAEIKQQYFSNVSHQLRTPLTEIIGMTELLSKTELDSRQQEYISSLRNSSETLINMISDILDVSKIEAGKMELYPSAYNLRKNVEKVVDALKSIAVEKNNKIECYVDENIPELIYVDGKRVNQVIFNLLSNAIKFSRDGEVSVRLFLESKKRKDLLIKAEVKDTGIGIRKEDHLDLFHAFQRTYQRKKRSTVGSGLGLYICKNLVELLGGDIGLESIPGRGSKFWFTFKTQEYEDDQADITPVAMQDSVPDELNMSVLLVEDKEENQKVLSLMLESIGCQVKIASNGKDALDLYKETVVNAFGIFGRVDYDAIIMDMHMPVMDGIAAAKELRRTYNELPPVIGLSASVLDNSTNVFNDLGFDDYLTKPVEIELLTKKLHYWNKKNKTENIKSGIIPEESFIDNIEKYPVINESTIKNIIKKVGNNVDNIKNLLNSFIDDMDNYYHKAIDAFKNNDEKTIMRIIIAIKGLSATIGASQVYEISKRMEHFAEEENFDQVKKLFPILIDKYTVFKDFVESKYL